MDNRNAVPDSSYVSHLRFRFFFMMFYSKSKGYSRRSRSTLELASGYSNTSFIGFPLISAFYGEGLLSIAIICDQTMFLPFLP